MHTSRLTGITAVALAAAALGAPAASARPVSEPGGNAPRPQSPSAMTLDQGFDWGSAATGVGAAGVVLLTAAGASVVARSRRAVRPVL
jgi:hypothetical protein